MLTLSPHQLKKVIAGLRIEVQRVEKLVRKEQMCCRLLLYFNPIRLLECPAFTWVPTDPNMDFKSKWINQCQAAKHIFLMAVWPAVYSSSNSGQDLDI